LVEIKGSAREGKGFEIACAQLCGNSHYRMRGFLTVESEDEYNAWLDEEAELLEEEGDDDDW
jgi:cytochrome c oxidase subunit 2